MSSISTSKILEVTDLHLVFKTHFYKNVGLRDLFVKTAKNPLQFLGRSADRFYLLQGLNFSINKGDRVGLIGINGTGKTSLCRCIAGIYNPSRGKIKINGEVRALFDTAIGFYPELTGRENAKLISELMYPGQNVTSELEEAFAFSELGDFLDTPFKFYSNGMQARLCLSIASMRSADLLILDEVFEGADQFFREKISARIEKLIGGSGATLFVSHSFDQIHRVCNRVLLLNKGQIVFDGSPVDAEKEFRKVGNLHV
jgi:ABC-type polysaccharide/polyol phosphate transport system ATPase subunit